MKTTSLVGLSLAVFMFIGACAPRQGLRIESAAMAEMPGSYSLILFGCRYLDDPETVAIFDREGDRYRFEPYSPEFNYRVEKDLSAEMALERAHRFINCHTSVQGERLSSIRDQPGTALGYELRPLYFPLTYGVDDILLTDYRIHGEKIIVNIRVIPPVERMLSNGLKDRDN
ncbi:MAG: hypothetical protein C0402_08675 [Thermodesulfovibrio sp.]|nr:hypothetical protein [Thermodesulfovibrio sp.]